MRPITSAEAWQAISMRILDLEAILEVHGIEAATISHANEEPDYGAVISLKRDHTLIPEESFPAQLHFDAMVLSERRDGQPAFFEIAEPQSGMTLHEAVYHLGEELSGYMVATTGVRDFEGFTMTLALNGAARSFSLATGETVTWSPPTTGRPPSDTSPSGI